MSLDGACRTPRRCWPRWSSSRWAWLAVLCVVLGLVTSLGVAWGIAWNSGGYDPLEMVPMGMEPKTDGGGMRFIDEPEFVHGLSSRVADLTPSEHEALVLDLSRIGEGLDPVHKPNAWGGYRLTLPGCVHNVFHAAWADSIEEAPKAQFYQLFHDSASQMALRRHAALMIARDAYYVEFCVSTYGWPCRALSLERACTQAQVLQVKGNNFDIDPASPPDPTYSLNPLYHAVRLPGAVLPTFPHWPGLLANTAFYSGVWAILLGVSFIACRWFVQRRVRQGRCPACGYSREAWKEGALCPECGRGA